MGKGTGVAGWGGERSGKLDRPTRISCLLPRAALGSCWVHSALVGPHPTSPPPLPHSHRRSAPTLTRSTCPMCWGCPCTRWWCAPSGWVSLGEGRWDWGMQLQEGGQRPEQQAASSSLPCHAGFVCCCWLGAYQVLARQKGSAAEQPTALVPPPPRLCAQAAALAARSRAQHSSTPPAPSPPTTCASLCGGCAGRQRVLLHVSCLQTPRLCWPCRLLVCGGSLCPALAAAVRS
jgi:hypothetical protein